MQSWNGATTPMTCTKVCLCKNTHEEHQSAKIPEQNSGKKRLFVQEANMSSQHMIDV